MKEELQLNDCRYCNSKNVKVTQVDRQMDGEYFAVVCNCCWAEGPHSVTEEMAIRFWGIKEPEFVQQPQPVDWSKFENHNANNNTSEQ